MKAYTTNWKPHGQAAEQAIEHLSKHLDHRKKSFRDEDRTRRVLSGFLAVREGPFSVHLTQLPKDDRGAVRDAIEGLLGVALKRIPKGKNLYEFRPDFISYRTQVKTIEGTHPVEVETKWGAIHTDDSVRLLTFEDVGRVGYAKPNLVEIVSPHHHWEMFLDGKEKPSNFWHELEESPKPHPKHDEMMDFIVAHMAKRGVMVVRIGESGLLCAHIDQTCRLLDIAIQAYTGDHLCKPLLQAQDIYRTMPRAGSYSMG